MKLLTFLCSLSFLVLSVFAQDASPNTDAPITNDNPSMATFQAVLQKDKPIQGQITGVSNDNGTGVNFNVNFYNFHDEEGAGPFKYHIHTLPVPPDGNCTGTAGHLSPFGRGETPPCDTTTTATGAATCQPGDLSGKHGSISGNATFQTYYLDLYLSTDPGNEAFFGNRSVVVHAANGTRLNCANFTQQVAGSNVAGGGGGPSNSSSGASGSNNSNPPSPSSSSSSGSGGGTSTGNTSSSASAAGTQGGFSGLLRGEMAVFAAGLVAVVFALL